MPVITMSSLTAQQQFGTLIDTSQRQPVTVTRRGRPVALVISYADGEEFLRSRERDKALIRAYMKAKQDGVPTDELPPLPKNITWELAKFISDNYPLRGKEARDAMRKHLASMSNRAAEEGLTEEDVMQMLNEND